MADNDSSSGRGENSVLFSLSNLTAVGAQDAKQQQAAPSAGDAAKDKSGLIDLNTLTSLGAGGAAEAESDLGGGGGGGANAMPALFNVGTRRSNKGLVFGISALVLVVLGLGGFLLYLLVLKEEPAAPAEAAAEEAADDVEDPDLGDAGKGKAIAADKAEDEDDEDDEEEDDEEEDDEEAEADAEAAAQTDAKKKSDGKKKKSDGKKKTDGKKKKKDGGVDSSLDKIRKKDGDTLSKAQIGPVLKSGVLAAKKCGSGGTVKTKFNIKGSGSTSGVVVVGGSLSGGPEAKCVTKVVKGLKFPKSGSGTGGKKVTYTFKL